MVRVKPELLLDPADPKHWRHSADAGGSPGQSDAIAFPGGALDDGDSDSLPALMEYLLDGDDADGSDPGTRFAAYFGAFDDGTFPAIIVQRRTAADCGFVSAQYARDYVEWFDAEYVETLVDPATPGVSQIIFRAPVPDEPRLGFRVVGECWEACE